MKQNTTTTTLEEKRTSFIAAHEDFQKSLRIYSSFKVQSPTLSEDLVQDTFIKTWMYLAKGGEVHKMKAFLYHVLNGLIIDEYRKHKSMSLDLLMESGFEPGEDLISKEADVFDGKIAVSMIDKLPTAYRKIMRMRYVQHLSLAEIARITGKSKNTTAVHAHRGLEKLRLLYNHNSQKIAA
jgi:RNA polymerase sigma-70 factor, ECF subfamily